MSTGQTLQEKIEAAKAQQTAQQKPAETTEVTEQKTEVTESKPDDLDALVSAFGVEQNHPRAPIIMDEISEEEKAEALAAAQANIVKPQRYY